MATGFGLRPVGRMGGGSVSHSNEYYVPSTDSTALMVGDVVSLAATGAMDPDNRKRVITRATAGHSVVGVVTGFRPNGVVSTGPDYRVASTNRYVLVNDDPNTIYEVQEDAVGNAVTAQEIGEMQNAAIVVAAGSTVTGLSGTMLDSDSVAATSDTLKIVGVSQRPADAAAATAGAILRVVIFEHAYKRVDSVNSDGSITE